MKTLALIVTLILHVTGVWSHLPAHARAHLTATTASAQIASQPSEIATRQAPIGPMPIRTGAEPLQLTAASAYAIDTTTDTVLFAQNAAARRPIASITKLITAIVILSRHSPDEMVTVPALPTYQPEDELIGLVPGESYRLGDLIQAALIPSANDAGDALALADAGTIPKFAAKMNIKMAEWGISGTRFSNPTGLQDSGNYTTAEALAKIATLALANPFIRQTVGTSQTTISSTTGHTLNLVSTNNLLATGTFYGIKTGYTLAAGECFVGLTRIQGHEVITVVLGADDRFGTTQTLTNWIGRNWQWL